MAKRSLREDKTCQNCGGIVPERYCSSCGQENVETRQSFRELLGHAFKDITHYDGKFWISLKYLFFKPAYLTKQTTLGKRSSFLHPVRLYIFASFVTFLLPHLLPYPEDEHQMYVPTRADVDTGFIDTSFDDRFYWSPDTGIVAVSKLKTFHQLDSAREASKTLGIPMDYLDYIVHKKIIEFKFQTPAELNKRFLDTLMKNFPKALFLYLPLFALVLLLFHSQKKWFYFDHATFTLHYFSFILLAFNIYNIVSWIGYWIEASYEHTVVPEVEGIIFLVMLLWFILYFFRAHRVMYGGSRLESTAIAFFIFTINLGLFVVLFIALLTLTIITMH